MNGVATITRRRLWALAWIVAVVPSAASAIGGLAVEGVDAARLLPPAGALVEDYRNAGYRLQWIGDEIAIEVDTSPISSDTRFEPPREANAGPIGRLARGLTIGAETRYEAISRVLGWVAVHLEYELDRSQLQSAGAVLERRSGYCTGVARLTVALLEAVNIPAREVAGYVVGSEPGQPSGYHRWIEAYLPDRGWVFSDPLATHHYVAATYLRLAAEDLEPQRGTEGLLLERRDAVAAVDMYPLAGPGVTARRNTDRQLAAALRVRLEDQSTGTAVLEGPSTRWTHALIDGENDFRGSRSRQLPASAVAAGKRRPREPGRAARSNSQSSAGHGSRVPRRPPRTQPGRVAGESENREGMRMTQRIRGNPAAILAVAALMAGCGYNLVGRASTIPEDVHSIFVAPLINATQRAQVEQILTQAISDELVTRRRFAVLNSASGADAVLRGTVLTFSVRPLTFDADGLADNFEISITADMRFERPPALGADEAEVIWSNSRYLFRQDYPLEEGAAYFDRENLAIEETSVRFAETMVTDLLEGF